MQGDKRMKRVYEAFDGKLFKDDKECLAYEQNLKEENVVKNVKFYDSNNNLINIEKIYDINYILYNIYKIVIFSNLTNRYYLCYFFIAFNLKAA